jgi:hypothetical protein
VARKDPNDDELMRRLGEPGREPQTGGRAVLIGCLCLVLAAMAGIGVFVYFQLKPAAAPVEADEDWDRLVGTWELRDLAGRRCSFEFGADRSYRRIGYEQAGKRIEETGRVVKFEFRDAQPPTRERTYVLEIEYDRNSGGPATATFTLDDAGQLHGPGLIGAYKKVR